MKSFDILTYVQKFIKVSPEMEEVLKSSSMVKSFKKGDVLLKEGQIPREGYLVVEGCVRSYYLRDGEEVSTAFFTKEQTVYTPAFDAQEPADHYLDCVTDTVLLAGTFDEGEEVLAQYPEAKEICRLVTEHMLNSRQKEFDYFRLSSPEERYLKLMKDRPELLQLVPQYQIASFLGIQPESLSRIRKRLFDK